jgi:hypothetical protein
MQIHSPKSLPVRVRELSTSDYGAINALESQYELESRTYEEWIHLWDANPAFKQIETAWIRGWVLEDDDSRVVGYLANIPLWYEFEGQRFVAATSHAWVVDSRYRKYSILLLEPCFHQQNVDLYLCTSANEKSSGIIAMFNSSRVPVGSWDEALFWITDYLGFVGSWATMKSMPLVRPLRRAFSGVLWLRDLTARRSLAHTDHGLPVEFHDDFDERFDVFWEMLRRQRAHSFLAVRTREVLQWHFKHALLRKRAWILTIADGVNLLAYSIFRRQDSSKYGLQRVRLIDFQALNGNTALLLPMLRSALAMCRDQGIHMLEYIGARRQVKDILASLHPHQRKLPSWLYYYTAADEVLASRLADPSVWDPSCFDGDSSL